MKLKIYTGEELRELRRKLSVNQLEFWTQFHVTQSGGSRYESGRTIPDPVQVLLNLALSPERKAEAILADLRKISQRPKRHKLSNREET